MTKSASSRELYLRLLQYVRPYWKAILLSLGATAIMAATEPMFPALLKPLLDEGFASQGGGVGNPLLIPLGIVGVFILRGVFNYLSSYGFSWVSNRVISDIRAEMYGRMVRLPNSYFQKNASSVPLTKIAYDVNGVASAATNVIVTVLKDGLVVIGLLCWLLWLNWQLTLICFALIPAVAWAMRTFSGRLRKASRAAQVSTAHMVQVLQETAHCERVIKVFGGESQEAERFHRTNDEVRRQNMRQAVAAAATNPIVQMFAAMAVAVVIYVAQVQSASGQITVGSFVSFITALLMLLSPLRHLADINAPLQRGLAAAESVFQLLDEVPESDDGKLDAGHVSGHLLFRDVTFRYPRAERNALSGINLDIAPGQTVALVGQSGGGKSTLAALVPRFHNPDGGAILIDGNDVRTLSMHSLRRNIAYVSQDVLLFNDSVAANIAYGDMAGAPLEAIEAAAAAANALDFIRALPNGFDTVIGENGNNLSGGQRQRLAIARAILKDAPILILDEATSALDNESERLVQGALENLMKKRTTLVIAHRLSTIEKADLIVVLGEGRILESGRHGDLLAMNGAYARLHSLQMQTESMREEA
ncbi:lipid A export permease/ATP-binding protein MsbA [Dechloromonas sp. ARDL1]|uniref:lipid A export permease/ATP-binding protein MsbA n=1 Tax=Dechloromonas sp. ARDL1 TaxID=3322121 RepID=UPI003DA73B10